VKKYCRARYATNDNMAHAHCRWIPKATNTNKEYVILIAFPLQQWLHDASVLRLHVHWLASLVLCLLYTQACC